MEAEIEKALSRMKNNRREREENVGFSQEVDVNEKENSHPLLRDKTKTRLERLGVLYGGGEVSSPIHKSEQMWDEEECDEASGDKSPYAERRTRRFQALANTINSWEDDVRHISPRKEQEERIDRFGNLVGSKAVKHETVQTPRKNQNGQTPRKNQNGQTPLKTQNGQTPKKVAWDKKIISNLEMQGFKRCESEEHLVYNYKTPESKECISPGRRRVQQQMPNIKDRSPSPVKANLIIKDRSPSPKRIVTSPVRALPLPVLQPKIAAPIKQAVVDSGPSVVRNVANQFRERSPQRTTVLEMAAQYESDSPSPTKIADSTVDPAMLSVAQKKAVFERNRGTAPMPQALPKPRALSPPKRLPLPAKVLTQEKCVAKESPVKDSVKQAMIERFQELEALRHRWDRNRAVAANEVEENAVEEPMEEEEEEDCNAQIPSPPPLPRHSYCEDMDNPSLPGTSSPPPQIRMGVSSPVGKKSPLGPPRQLPRVLSVREKTYQTTGLYPEVKKVKVSPPKPGRLYPSISDIEASESEMTETDLETIDEEYMDEEEQGEQTSFMDSSCLETSQSSQSSFGREIVRQASKTNLKRPSHSFEESSSSENESKILRDMDNLLDEALGSPSPKRSRDTSGYQGRTSTSESCSTTSFEYSDADQHHHSVTKKAEPEVKTPLIHSVSLYRRQQNQVVLTPMRKEVRREVVVLEDEKNMSVDSSESEEELVLQKIKELTIEMQRQIETVSQASKALNLCLSTPGFTGSTAEVEAQKLLLVASSRWTSLKQEIERLRIEKRLRAGGFGMDRGDITLQSMSVPLKASLSSRDHSSQIHLVCLVRTGCVVLQTEVIPLDKTSIKNGRVTFQKILNLVDLYSDFTVSIEVYGFTAQRPVDQANDYKTRTTPSKKDKSRSALAKKQKDKFPPIESPAGPNAVRSSGFILWGFAVFSLRELNRTSFSLSKVPYTCPLEGSIELSLSSSMQSQVEHSGFLTVYEDVSGFGAWKRRWSELKGSSLAFWTYPEHCREGKIAIDTIDLATVSTVEAGLAPRDICARPHTILLESQVRGSTLEESLVVRRRGDMTVVMHLLSADTKDERLAWSKQINKVLHLLRAWKVNCATAV